MQVEALFGSEHEADHLRITSAGLADKTPAAVLAAVQLGTLVHPDLTLEIAVRGGRTLLGGWNADVAGQTARRDDVWLTFVEALIEIQAHTFTKILIPRTLTEATYDEIVRAARLLRNEVLEEEWEGFSMVVSSLDGIRPEPEFAMLLRQPMTVTLDDQKIELDRTLQVHFPAVRREGAENGEVVKVGDQITLIPGSLPKASLRAF